MRPVQRTDVTAAGIFLNITLPVPHAQRCRLQGEDTCVQIPTKIILISKQKRKIYFIFLFIIYLKSGTIITTVAFQE